MGLVDGFLLLGLFFIGLPAAAVIGSLLGRILHMPRLGGCLPLLVLLTIIFGVPVALRVTGVQGTAHVAQKRETLNVFGYTGHWYNKYNVVLHFTPPGASRADASSRVAATDSLALSVAATRDAFDRMHVGDAVSVAYLPFRPSIGKLSDRSFVDLLREMLAIPDISLLVLLFLAIIVAIALAKSKIENAAVRTVKRALIGVCMAVVIIAGWLSYQNPRPVPESAVNTAGTAHVVQVHRIDRTLFAYSSSSRQQSSEALAQPFDVIEVEFIPLARDQSVHAADAVDSGSVRGLSEGAPLSIRYDAGAPRTIRIDGGTRTYRAQNAGAMRNETLLMAGVLLLLVGISVVLERRKRSRARRLAQ